MSPPDVNEEEAQSPGQTHNEGPPGTIAAHRKNEQSDADRGEWPQSTLRKGRVGDQSTYHRQNQGAETAWLRRKGNGHGSRIRGRS